MCVCVCVRVCVKERGHKCVLVYSSSLEPSFVYMQKVVFHFLGVSSVLSCFLPTLAVCFFILPLYLSCLLGNISSSLSLFYGVFLLLHLPVMLVLYLFHNLWCCYFPCQLSLLYWRLYFYDSLSLLYFSPTLSNLSSQLWFWKYSGIFGHLLVTLFYWFLLVTYCYIAVTEFHEESQDALTV